MNYTNFKVEGIGLYGPIKVKRLYMDNYMKTIEFEWYGIKGTVSMNDIQNIVEDFPIQCIIGISDFGSIIYEPKTKKLVMKRLTQEKKNLFIEILTEIDRKIIDIPAEIFTDLLIDRN